MSNQENIVEVYFSVGISYRHRADSFRVNETGHLFVDLDKYPVAIYAPGKWEKVYIAGNLQPKA